jgi:hypothetical protein
MDFDHGNSLPLDSLLTGQKEAKPLVPRILRPCNSGEQWHPCHDCQIDLRNK